MKIFRGFEEAVGIRNPVVTTGSFDGVHVGHLTIINRLRMLAAKYDGESVLITFDPHPRKVLYPETVGRELKLIYSQEEKLLKLREAGLDNVIIVNFTIEFSKITSEAFVRKFLCEKLKSKVVVVGFNHHFGFNREGDYRQLWEWKDKYGFEAEEIPEQEVQHETVSSTRIRKAIQEGYIQRANAYLDHYYMIIGDTKPVIFNHLSGMNDFRKVVLTEECKLLPSAGIYAVSASYPEGESFKGMAVITGNAQPEVLFYPVELPANPGSKISLWFHKKIYGSIEIADPSSLAKIKNAIGEISELIY
jgi:riboflavin kinase/FMN adenylyltransferase